MCLELLLIGDHLQTGLFRISDRFVRRWGRCARESFLVIAKSPDAVGSARWRVDLAARTVALASGGGPGEDVRAGVSWQIIGEASTWEQIIRRRANLNVALRRRDLRYYATAEATALTASRLSMLADLLGITSWRAAEPTQQHPHPAPALT